MESDGGHLVVFREETESNEAQGPVFSAHVVRDDSGPDMAHHQTHQGIIVGPASTDIGRWDVSSPPARPRGHLGVVWTAFLTDVRFLAAY